MEPHNLDTAFTIWAAVVALIGGAIVWEIARLRGDVKALTLMLNEHMLHTEHRITTIETHLSMRDGFTPVRRKAS